MKRTGLGPVVLLAAMAAALAGMNGAIAADAGSGTSATPVAGKAPSPWWETLRGLPDWSGAWGLDDPSFAQTISDSTGKNPNDPPLTPKYAAMRAANGAANHGQGPEGGVETNSVNCIPDGMPGIMTAPFAFEFVISPGRVTILPENNEVRRIYTDGRSRPEDPDPTYEGLSIGHWEGQTLVVETSGMLAQAELFVGLHVTEHTNVSERIFRRDQQTMQIDTVVTDPDIFTTAWHYTRTYKRSNSGMIEYVCEQNNRDRNWKINLTPPK
jgi:hypothetical protein